MDRHGDHSLNCMVVCGPSGQAYYVSACWPGRLNDKRVLRNSSLAVEFDGGWRPVPNGILLGDSGYAVSPWLISPIGGGALTLQEENFNRAHRSTRRIVECYFGVLKQRFNCLAIPLRVDPVYAGNIFKCCTVIQNIISETRNDNVAAFEPVIDELNNDLINNALVVGDPRNDVLRFF